MKALDPIISIPVDLTNPGQFFACCGLLELGSRIDDAAAGYFKNGTFVLVQVSKDLISQFLDCNICGQSPSTSEDKGEDKKSSMRIGAPFNLTLDWWREDNPDQGAVEAKLKTWSAGMKVSDIFCSAQTPKSKKGNTTPTYDGLRGWMSYMVQNFPEDWLQQSIPIKSPKAFNYDSRLSRNNALDLGHTAGGVFAFSPAIDVLALIGLQRFRPEVMTPWDRNRFYTWSVPLPVNIAAVASLGLIPDLIDSCFEFPMIRRDAAGKFKLVGHAQPIRRHHV